MSAREGLWVGAIAWGLMSAGVPGMSGCSRREPPAATQPASTWPADTTSSQPAGMERLVSPPASGRAERALASESSTAPAAVPESIAATQPLMATEVPPFEPLADARVGEWVRLVGLNGRELRYEVVQAEAATVATRVTVHENGKLLGLPTTREDMRAWDPLAALARSTQAARTATRSVVQLAGRSWNAVLYEDRWTDEGVSYVRRTWVHPEVPVLGTLRLELYGDNALEARLELAAFGFGPAGVERP